MAAASERAAGIANLAAFAGTCSVALHDTILSHHSLQQRVRNLGDETKDLAQILQSLETAAQVKTRLQNPLLETPLKRCAKACQEFKQQIKRLSYTAGHPDKSSCDWASLRYLGEDINGFREILSGYKMTIVVALTDATIQESLVTPEVIQGYTELLRSARADLNGRIETINEAIQAESSRQSATRPASKGSQVEELREERQSTQDCLKVCAQLSDHISRLRSANTNRPLDSSEAELSDINDGLPECKASVSSLLADLEAREEELFSKLLDKLEATDPASVSAEEITALRSEVDSTRRSMKVLQSARNQLERQTSVIENHATGDAVQFMVSTKGKLLRGKNRSLGWKARQGGGYMDDETVKQLSQDWSSLEFRPGDSGARAMPAARQAEFHERFGHGFKLTK